MSYFQDRLSHNKRRFEELNEEQILVEGFDTEFPINASPIHKRPFTLVGSAAMLQTERLWWGISASELFIPTEIPTPFLPEPGLVFVRADGSRYVVVVEDSESPCYRPTTATRDRFIVCTVLELLGET